MRLKEKMFELAAEYESIKLKGVLIQFAYFLIHYLSKVPILSAFGIVQSKLVTNSNSNFILLQTSQPNSNSNISLSQNVLILYFVSLIGIVLTINRKKNQQQAKILFFGFLLIESLNELGSFYLIQLCIGNETVILRVLAIIFLVLAQLPMIMIEKLFISYEGTKLNSFSHKSSNFLMFLKVLERIDFYAIVALTLMGKDEPYLRNLFYASLTVIYAIRTYLYVSEKYFIQNLSHLLESIGSSLCLILLVIISLYEISEQPLLEQNFYGLCFILGVFSFMSIYSFIKYMNNQYLFMPMDQITSRQLIIPYLTAFYYLWNNQSSTINSSFISSFKKNHRISCHDLTCLCKKQLKSEDSNIIFLENYLKKSFKYLLSYSKDPNVILQILFLRLEMFHQIFSVNQKLKQIKADSRFNDISTQAGVHILSKKLQALISLRNSQSVSIDVIAVLNLEQKINCIEGIVLDDIRIKRHKWKYLCQSICKSTDIEQDIVQQISNIIAFEGLYHENKLNYKKNLAFNCLSLFYYGSIVFLKKEIDHIEENIRQIVNPIKKNFINYEKQLQDDIFNHNCCLLEFDIHLQNQDSEQFQLTVSNCNKNTENVFGWEKSQMVGFKIAKIFPKFLQNGMKSMLNDFFLSKSFNNKVQNYYYVDSKQHVFEGLSCMKIVAKHDIIEFVLFVLKKDYDNLILLNDRGLIENASQEYVDLFSKDYQKLPLSSLFGTPQDFTQIKFNECQQKRKVNLIDAKSMKQGWGMYLQNVMNYTEKDDFKSMMHIGTSIHNIALNKSLLKKYYDFLKNERRELVNLKKKTASFVSINFNRQHKPSRITLLLIDVLIRYKMCILNSQVFYKVVLQRVEKKNFFQTEAFQSTKGRINIGNDYLSPLKMGNPFNVEDESFMSQDQKDMNQNNENGSYDDFVQQHNTDSNGISTEQKHPKSPSDIIVEKNSIQSSLKTEDLVSFNNRFIEICFKLFKNPKQIKDKRLKFFTANSFIFSVLFVALLCGSFIIFRLSLIQVKDIFFADGAVSDNMQLTQFMYNRALNFKLHQNNDTYIEMIRKSAHFQREYLYSLMLSDQQKLLSVVTSMTKTRFYEYIKVPVKWEDCNSNTDYVEIQSNQFLLFYKLLSMNIEAGVKKGIGEGLTQVQESLKLMKKNFPQLKRINHLNLFLYKQSSDRSLSLTQSLLLFLSVAHVMLSIGVFCVFYRQKMFRRMQQIEGYSIYKIIPPKIIDILANYYGKYAEENKTDADLLKYEHYFENYGLVLCQDHRSSLKPNKSVFLTNNKSPRAVYKMLFVLLIMNVFYTFFIFKINQLVQPIKAMMNNVNDLMDSQNYLLQAYFDLKANFIVDHQMQLNPQFYDQLLETQQQSEVIFNKISVQSLTLFTNYDPNFSSDFIYLLINDSCDIARGDLSDTEYDKCKTFFKLKFLQNGVTMAMNYFTRKVRETIIEVKKLVAGQLKQGKLPEEIKRQMVERFRNDPEFKEIDESIFYMFKLYQGTQSKIYGSLETTIVSTMDMCLLLVMMEIAVIGVLYPLSLIKNYRQEKFQLSKLYVSFLLIPAPVSQFIKAFSQKIQHILEYN